MKKFIGKIKDFLKFRGREKIKFIIGIVLGLAAGGQFFASAENFIDSFLDTSKVSDTWNVEVDTANGEVKLAQRSCDNTVWFCDLTWRCPGLAGDGNGLLVKRTNEANKQWKIWNTACDTPECGIDGGQSDNLVVDNTLDFSAYYPARQACKDVGGRLPTLAELQCIYTYRGTYGINFGVSPYHWWSSTEVDSGNVNTVYYTGSVGTVGKASTYLLRCVRGW
ncbi:MAG: hypothetical protein ACWGHO_04120 [Candidatus Moraniibacteriota bacterium]